MANYRFMKYFDYEHLPENLRDSAKLFHDMATRLDQVLPDSIDTTVCFSKLLEAKQACMRSLVESKIVESKNHVIKERQS